MKATMKKVSVLAGMLSCCAVLSGCLTHWFVDSTTRLQIENRSSKTVVEIDILAEDGTGYKVWIQDTIRTGEKSRVYEEDWVGTFNMRIRTFGSDYEIDNLKLEGGSEYMVLSDSANGSLHYEFK
jgi:hypothetical protein